jgi:hypothetical protein
MAHADVVSLDIFTVFLRGRQLRRCDVKMVRLERAHC